MHLRVLAMSISFAIAVPLVVSAQVMRLPTWTSPDGFLSVEIPDETRFQALPTPPPPFLVIWISNDESTKLGVMKTQIPPDRKFIQSSVENGFAKEMGGKVTRLPTKMVSGHEVWSMAGQTPSGEITQAIVRHNDAAYKLMGMTISGNPDTAAIDRFMNSLSITQPPPANAQPSTQLGSVPEKGPGDGLDFTDSSEKIGGASALLLIILIIYAISRGKAKRQE